MNPPDRKDPADKNRLEPRWPVMCALVAVIALLTVLPGVIRLFPIWVSYLVGGVVLTPMAAVSLSAGQAHWLRLERVIVRIFFVAVVVNILANIAHVIHEMVARSAEVGGLQWIASSIAVWVVNVLVFSLFFWQLDRDGPEARIHQPDVRADWLFPQEGAPPEHVPPGWHPVYVDYLFLAYSTATAFSATDTLPLTARAKLLMMLESSISLVTIMVVAARAINILG